MAKKKKRVKKAAKGSTVVPRKKKKKKVASDATSASASTPRKKKRKKVRRVAESQSDAVSESSANGAPTKKRKRRATAQTMAASQRDISVSEFFAKNRHLLGFDNPRKALLTTIKEAVDNSLDACEEAGILPEIWVHIEQTGSDRYKVGIQDNGPGILKKQIPLIFGKLLYGSKFHRLRQSRGQQGIGISAAGMYGVQTTGKPIKIISKVSVRKPAHYYELQIDTKRNQPKIMNGKGDGVDIPPGEKGAKYIEKHGIEWVEEKSGTRVTIELQAKYTRGRGSVDEYLEQTAIANPHVTLHYLDPDGGGRDYPRSTDKLPPEPKEILPHPYGVELGRLATMLQEAEGVTVSQFLTGNFSRVTPSVARKICEKAKVSTRANSKKMGRQEADAIYHAIQDTKISNPSTDCICPIGEELILKGLHQVVPGEFYAAATRPPSVYRGNPFQIEVGLAYGGAAPAQNVSKDLLNELLDETDARTCRQFLINTFNGMGAEAADKILKASKLGTRQSPRQAHSEATGCIIGLDEEREHQRGPIDERAATGQPCAFAVPTWCLCDHAISHWQQLEELRSYPISRQPTERPGEHHGPHRQRVGTVHQRIKRSRGQLPGNPERAAPRFASRGSQTRHVPTPPAESSPTDRPSRSVPTLPKRSFQCRKRNQRREA